MEASPASTFRHGCRPWVEHSRWSCCTKPTIASAGTLRLVSIRTVGSRPCPINSYNFDLLIDNTLAASLVVNSSFSTGSPSPFDICGRGSMV
jgi:hypothetical protein